MIYRPIRCGIACLISVFMLFAGFFPLVAFSGGVLSENMPVLRSSEVLNLSGTGFSGAKSVTVNGQVVKFEVRNDSEILVFPQQGLSGPLEVVVTTAAGSAHFTYDYKPAASAPVANLAITAIEPAEGPMTGGTIVNVEGAGFLKGEKIEVLFGEVPSTDVNVNSEALITAKAPGHSPGQVRLSVRIGDNRVESQGPFVYIAGPRITDLYPASGPVSGATEVTIKGNGFATTGFVNVHFGSVAAKSIEVKSSSEILVKTPPSVIGRTDVRVTNPDKQTGTLAGGFEYVGKPIIHAITPIMKSAP